ncbi:ribonuclease H-like domain-containing protein [Obelidium mucronatum]|nr:ribonuclease H-like domain-containing protein [Obelidium mucronatum]
MQSADALLLNKTILMCNSIKTVGHTLKQCSGPLVAIDAEWNVIKRRGVSQRKTSMLQVYNGHTVGLFRLNLLTDGFKNPVPPELCELLHDENVVKVGLNIHGDAGKLFRDYGLCMNGYIELMRLAKVACPEHLVRHAKTGNLQNPSLNHLSSVLLGRVLDKSDSLRMGNWETKVLNPKMAQYAAADVVASWQVYQVLAERLVPGAPVVVERYMPKAL